MFGNFKKVPRRSIEFNSEPIEWDVLDGENRTLVQDWTARSTEDAKEKVDTTDDVT